MDAEVKAPLSNEKKSRFLLAGILALALLLRLGLLVGMGDYLQRAVLPDTDDYIAPAVALLQTGAYPEDEGFRTPVYPLFIALVFLLFGQNLLALGVAQALISTASVYLTWLIASRFLPGRVALTASAILSLSMLSITYTFFLVTETLFTFLLLVSTWFWLRGVQSTNRLFWCLAGFGFGLAVLCRPIGLVYPFLLVVPALLNRRSPLKSRLLSQALFMSVLVLTLTPWVVRNARVVGMPVISTVTNVNLYFYNAVALEANLHGISENEMRQEFVERVSRAVQDAGLPDTTGSRVKLYGTLARRIISTHPLRYLYLHLKSDLNTLIPDVTGLTEIFGLTIGGRGTLSVLNQYGVQAAIQHYFGNQAWLLWIFAPVILLHGLFYLSALIGIPVTFQHCKIAGLAVLILPVAYFLLAPGAPSLPRFRVPVTPALSMLAAAGIFHLYARLFSSPRGANDS